MTSSLERLQQVREVTESSMDGTETPRLPPQVLSEVQEEEDEEAQRRRLGRRRDSMMRVLRNNLREAGSLSSLVSRHFSQCSQSMMDLTDNEVFLPGRQNGNMRRVSSLRSLGRLSRSSESDDVFMPLTGREGDRRQSFRRTLGMMGAPTLHRLPPVAPPNLGIRDNISVLEGGPFTSKKGRRMSFQNNSRQDKAYRKEVQARMLQKVQKRAAKDARLRPGALRTPDTIISDTESSRETRTDIVSQMSSRSRGSVSRTDEIKTSSKRDAFQRRDSRRIMGRQSDGLPLRQGVDTSDPSPRYEQRESLSREDAEALKDKLMKQRDTFEQQDRDSRRSLFAPRDGASLPRTESVSESVFSVATSDEDRSSRLAALKPRLRRQRRKGKNFGRFKRTAHFVMVLISLWKLHRQKIQSILEVFGSLDMMGEGQDSMAPTEALMFDITDYKRSKEVGISADARRILQMRPEVRTEKELHHVQIALRNYESLASYPISMQRKLASRAWHEQYSPKRLILREGHVARCFYFILSGSAVVTVHDEIMNKEKTVMFLKQGDSFGDLALTNNTTREATVISKSPIQLLVIGDEDFTEMFLAGGLKNTSDPFFRNLPMFKHWPVELLAQETPGTRRALFSFFKPGTVLCQDTSESDWIYIVKSGSCSVMKKLKPIKPPTPPSKPTSPADEGPEEKLSRKLLEAASQQEDEGDSFMRRFDRPIQLRIQRSDEYEDKMAKQRQKIEQMHAQNAAMLSTPRSQNGNAVEKAEGRKGVKDTEDREKEKDRPEGGEVTSLKDEEGLRDTFSPGKMGGKLINLTLRTPYMQAKSISSLSAAAEETAAGATYKTKSTEAADETKSRDGGVSTVFEPEKTIFSDAASSVAEDEPPKDEIVFVNVRTLTKGMTFGLEDVLYGPQTPFSLVSNGMECIMLDKKFYSDNSEPVNLLTLRDDISKYPPEEELQDNLELFVKWQAHKKDTMKDVLVTQAVREEIRCLNTLIHPLKAMTGPVPTPVK